MSTSTSAKDVRITSTSPEQAPPFYGQALPTVSNFRDIGGYCTENMKHRVKKGMLFRSSNFTMGDRADIEDKVRDKYGIKTILDFRGDGEIVKAEEVAKSQRKKEGKEEYNFKYLYPRFEVVVHEPMKGGTKPAREEQMLDGGFYFMHSDRIHSAPGAYYGTPKKEKKVKCHVESLLELEKLFGHKEGDSMVFRKTFAMDTTKRTVNAVLRWYQFVLIVILFIFRLSHFAVKLLMNWISNKYGPLGSYKLLLKHQRKELEFIFRHVFPDESMYPIAFSCSAGKDRTGTVAALILSVLGVADADVAADYQRTNLFLAPIFIDMQKSLGMSEEWNTCRSQTMQELLKFIREEYGGVEAYLTNQLHVTPEELRKIKSLLLVSA